MPTEIKISELPAAASANGTMQFETNDSGTSKKVTGSQLKTYATSDLGTISTQNANSVAITGGAIDGVTIGNTTAATIVKVDNLSLDGNTIASTNSNGNITIAPNGTGQVVVNAGAVGTPTIAPTGDLNTGIFFPAADTIAFAEGGAEAMRIDSSGNVGIGTSSPVYNLDLVGSGGIAQNIRSTTSAASSYTLYQNADCDSSSARGFYVGQEGSVAYVWNFENQPLVFAANNAARGEFLANGNLRLVHNLSVGGATPTTSGSGITFPATQSASSDANTLDDYEEGTWTPDVTFGGGSTSLTYSSRAGTYTKIGRVVVASFDVRLSAKGSSTGAFKISLPFTSSGSGGGGSTYFTGANTVDSLPGMGADAGATTGFYVCFDGATTALDHTHLTDSSIIIGTITFIV